MNVANSNGVYLTPPDLAALTARLLVQKIPPVKNKIAVYDNSLGIGNLLLETYKIVAEKSENKTIKLYGQELDPKMERAAKRQMKSLGLETKHIKCADALLNDVQGSKRFDYVCINPPFGVPFNPDQIKNDHRFDVGIPKSKDSQLLFLLDAVNKLYRTGRCAAIMSGGSLSSAWAGDGSDLIRKYIIENDWLECIIKLPSDLFNGTSINTYLWLVDKNKDDDRIGTVQLIDASKCFHTINSDDCKTHILKEIDINEIYEMYIEKTDNNGCKSVIVKNDELTHKRVCVIFDDEEHYYSVPKGMPIGKFLRKEVLSKKPNAVIDTSKTVDLYSINFDMFFNDKTETFVKTLKDYAKLIQGYHFKSKDLVEDYQFPVVKISNIKNDQIDLTKSVGITQINHVVERYKIHQNDILIALSGTQQGKCCFVENEPSKPCYANQRVGIIRCFDSDNANAFYNIINSNLNDWISLKSSNNVVPNINANILKDMPIKLK